MINHLLYIVGAPGVGKSSVARELTAAWDKDVHRTAPVPHVRLKHPMSGRVIGVELGVPRDSFSGTDALAMDIGPRALQFLSSQWAPFALGEGSRLGTRPFIGGLAQQGVKTTLVHLKASQDVLDLRCAERGSKQNPSWRKGAATRAEKLADWFEHHLGTDGFYQSLCLDTERHTATELAGLISDAFPHIDLRESAS